MTTTRTATAARETYHGRKLIVKKSKTAGYLEVFVNGQMIAKPIRQATPQNIALEMLTLRLTVDAADERTGAYAPYMYAGATR